MRNFLNNLGPGILVSAAFIGPGTVTVCTLAGVEFGYSLLWALLLSIFSCIILQEMAARLGVVSQKGLSDVIREEIKKPLFRVLAIILIFSAIVIGNAAYEAGNITGAVLGAEAIFGIQNLQLGDFTLNLWSIFIGAVAFILLFTGSYKTLEKIFIGLVLLMSISFVLTAILTKPDILEILNGLIPKSNAAGLLTVMAIVGTTVVPYNLFLHASLVSEKWKEASYLPIARKELIVSIILGGTVSMAILISAASSGLTNVNSAADMAVSLEPLFGKFATWFMSLGLLAAGITSSITAPLAAAYVVKGCFGWKGGMKSAKFKTVWAVVLILGVFFSSLQINPIEIIRFAQIANGILLPVIAIFLFWVVNKASVLGKHRNSKLQNTLGVLVIALSVFLGIKAILSVLQSF
ncbi:Nramp family divalent metal transporter [Salegentibacter salegens]|uniref:NRAMP (Natural resistance-associated macrophage protein) metal ion transporters n=1 Tax=Salegentibacter salegens TaxID=143223 RepID=A0A1M7NZR3_9FLAO|nr:Nramp family divalent metal transporter [Salegentibacter salegens]PRX46387.1 NRAMP (natural resistance-associated macrophage protein)-like metal ion transporter [Salegentibacter salegens]SHN09335.1 NRAMP (natural resistance-associated macrophage protein) metal ion transporters [Salegentibacter salegens]